MEKKKDAVKKTVVKREKVIKKPNEKKEILKTVKYVVTQEDLDNNRFLREEGIKVGEEIEVPENSVVKKEVEDIVTAEAPTYFTGPEGQLLPLEIEGHKVISVSGTVESGGKILFNCLCDDGCTYHTEKIA